MKEKIQKLIIRFCFVLELLISAIIGVAIVIIGSRWFVEMINVSLNDGTERLLETVLDGAMVLAIGVEFIKMLCQHTPETVVEVLLFAVARQLVLTHTSALDILLEVFAIAVLFAVRKYLFTKDDAQGNMISKKKYKKIFNINSTSDTENNLNINA